MVGVVPSPGRDAQKVILVIELEAFYILYNDVFESGVSCDVIDSEPGFVVQVFTFYNLFVYDLEILDLIVLHLLFFVLLLGLSDWFEI